MKLERLMERAAEIVLKRVKRADDLMPGIIISGPRGLVVLPLPWTSEADKAAWIEALRETMRQCDIESYAIWSEVWISTARTGDDPWHPSVMPRDDPDHQDAIVIIGAEKGREAMIRVWRVVKAGRATTLEERPEPGMVGGRLATLLEGPAFDA